MIAPPPLPVHLAAGDPLPKITAPRIGDTRPFQLDLMAGRHLLLLFFGSVRRPETLPALRLVAGNRALFDDQRAMFFGLTADPTDHQQRRVVDQLPGIRFLDDQASRAAQACGIVSRDGDVAAFVPAWLVVGPDLRVVARLPIERGEAALAALRAALDREAGAETFAPIIVVPNVFEPELCRLMTGLYDAHGGVESGFMNVVDGKTIGTYNDKVKRRKDYQIDDHELRSAMQMRIMRRLAPAIAQSFQFTVSRIERYIVACYDAADGGHFSRHRDNTTPATAHRRFAVTINLNDGYDGGDLSFPEFGTRTYRAPLGGAVVFSCSLLHEARRVTAGRRYATLPFLYDEAAAAVREANHHTLAARTAEYRA